MNIRYPIYEGVYRILTFQKPYVKYLNRLDYEKGIICSSTCYGIG